MKPDELEQKLSRQPVRQIPPAWRADILTAARAAQAPVHASRVTHHSWLSTIFWPHPKAWAGLAAVWILIFVVNFPMREPTPVIAEKVLPPSPEVLVALRQQHKLLVELIGPAELRMANRQPWLPPKPRSEMANPAVA